MRVSLKASSLSGTLIVPSSKSSMQRACAAALLRKGISFIYNPGISNDDKAALSIIQALGAKVEHLDHYIKIESEGVEGIKKAKVEQINCGESGLSIRMFTPIIALNENAIQINGEGSLAKRSMHFFDTVLPQLGVQFKSNNACIPFTVQGPLIAQDIKVDGSKSSQYITGLLMTYAAIPSSQNKSICIDNLKSKPYVDLSLTVMKSFGMQLPSNLDYKKFVFNNSKLNNTSSSIAYTVEGDWSSASFLLVAAAIDKQNTIILKGLDIQSTQADKAILKALKEAGAHVNIEEDQIRIHATALNAFTFDATDCPDLFPPLVALAAYCTGTSKIKGISRLIHKESNRELSLSQEFGKLGLRIYTEEDYMMIEGGQGIKATLTDAHNDHRIAMALSIAALGAEGEMQINGAEAINKSYPNFYQDLQKLGVAITFTN